MAARGGAQRVDGLEAPLTGRDHELRQVKALFHETEQDGRARIALVSGVAGVGKSRLGWEFEKYVDGLTSVVRWHRGRCLSYGDGVAFWAFAEMVRSRLQLLDSDDRQQVADKVREGVAAIATSLDEAAWLTPRVAALLTSGDKAVGFDRTDLFAAWTMFLERVGDDKPLVLLFEDSQHADTGLLDLVEHLLETSRARLLILVLCRPELLEQRPSLAAGRRATVIDLQPLDDEAMTSLVDALVDHLPVKARTALVTRAEGVPLYAVETVRSLIDRDAVQARDGRYVFVDDGSKVDLDQLAAPTSLQALIAARLDALTPVERRSVQDASVLGTSFRPAGLMALSDVSKHDLEIALSGLVRKGVVEAQNDPRSPELGSYRFLQSLVRQVAYNTLARKDRKSRHLAAAVHLEAAGEGLTDNLAGIIAQHLLDALDASSASDPDRPVTVARARALLTTSALRAEALGSAREALRSALAAIALDPEPLEAARLHEIAVRTALMAGEFLRAEELAALAVAQYDDLRREVDAVRARALRSRALANLGRVQEALDLAEATSVRADAADSAEAAVQLELTIMCSSGHRALGNGDQQQRAAFKAIWQAEQLDDPALLVRAINSLAIVLIDGGAPRTQKALLEWGIALSREGHLLQQLARSLANLTSTTYPDDLPRAADLAAEAVGISRQVGDSYQTEVALINAGFTWTLSGDWDRLLSETADWFADREPTVMSGGLQLSVAMVRLARGEDMPALWIPPSEDRYDRHTTELLQALQAATEGDFARAATQAAATTRLTFGSGEMLEDFEALWALAVDLQLSAGALEEAATLLELAAPFTTGRAPAAIRAQLPRLRGTLAAARGEDPEADLRTAEREFVAYGAPFYLARTRLELGRWLRQRGRTEQAGPLLEQARSAFSTLRAAPSLAELDAVERNHARAWVG